MRVRVRVRVRVLAVLRLTAALTALLLLPRVQLPEMPPPAEVVERRDWTEEADGCGEPPPPAKSWS